MEEAKTSGVEFQAGYRDHETLRVDGNYTYTDSKIKAVGSDWQRAVQIARNKGNLGFTYEEGMLSLGLNAYYSGPRLRWAGDVEMEEYIRLDLSTKLRCENGVELSTRIENLTDEKIEEGLGYEEPGLYAIVGVGYRF